MIGQLVTTNNYSFLEQDDLMQKIDFTLELGLEPFLEENLGLLNYDYVIFQRIRILQGLNIEVSKEELEQVLKADRFIVSDEEINKYLKLVSVSRNMLDEMRILPEDIRTGYMTLSGATTFPPRATFRFRWRRPTT